MYFNVICNAWTVHASKSRYDEKNGYLTSTNNMIQEQLNLIQKNKEVAAKHKKQI